MLIRRPSNVESALRGLLQAGAARRPGARRWSRAIHDHAGGRVAERAPAASRRKIAACVQKVIESIEFPDRGRRHGGCGLSVAALWLAGGNARQLKRMRRRLEPDATGATAFRSAAPASIIRISCDRRSPSGSAAPGGRTAGSAGVAAQGGSGSGERGGRHWPGQAVRAGGGEPAARAGGGAGCVPAPAGEQPFGDCRRAGRPARRHPAAVQGSTTTPPAPASSGSPASWRGRRCCALRRCAVAFGELPVADAPRRRDRHDEIRWLGRACQGHAATLPAPTSDKAGLDDSRAARAGLARTPTRTTPSRRPTVVVYAARSRVVLRAPVDAPMKLVNRRCWPRLEAARRRPRCSARKNWDAWQTPAPHGPTCRSCRSRWGPARSSSRPWYGEWGGLVDHPMLLLLVTTGAIPGRSRPEDLAGRGRRIVEEISATQRGPISTSSSACWPSAGVTVDL